MDTLMHQPIHGSKSVTIQVVCIFCSTRIHTPVVTLVVWRSNSSSEYKNEQIWSPSNGLRTWNFTDEVWLCFFSQRFLAVCVEAQISRCVCCDPSRIPWRLDSQQVYQPDWAIPWLKFFHFAKSFCWAKRQHLGGERVRRASQVREGSFSESKKSTHRFLNSDLGCSPTKTFKLPATSVAIAAEPFQVQQHSFWQRPKPLQFIAMLSEGLSCKLYKSLGGSVLTNQNFVLLTTTHYPTIPNQYVSWDLARRPMQSCIICTWRPWFEGVAGRAMASLRRYFPSAVLLPCLFFGVEVDEVSGSTYRKIKVI